VNNAKQTKNAAPLLDADIRRALIARLMRKYGAGRDAVVVGEFDCPGARADVAVINGKMHGFEIKSERDTLTRLQNQSPAYGAIFDRVTAVVASRHLKKIDKHVPAWWGILEVTTRSGRVCLKTVRRASPNPSPDALALAKMMWRKEALDVLRIRGLHKGFERAPVMDIWTRVASEVPLEEIARESRRAIKGRYGLQSAKPLSQYDGSYPTASTAQPLQLSSAD
jgi:hypothetical protein